MWIKGQSGNPSGRPKKTQEQLFVEQECREKFRDIALPVLIAWLGSGSESKFKFACEQLREIGFIPHAQSHDIATQSSNCGPNELAEKLAAIVGTGAGRCAGGDKPGGEAAVT